MRTKCVGPDGCALGQGKPAPLRWSNPCGGCRYVCVPTSNTRLDRSNPAAPSRASGAAAGPGPRSHATGAPAQTESPRAASDGAARTSRSRSPAAPDRSRLAERASDADRLKLSPRQRSGRFRFATRRREAARRRACSCRCLQKEFSRARCRTRGKIQKSGAAYAARLELTKYRAITDDHGLRNRRASRTLSPSEAFVRRLNPLG
jgi:hypothetical protein